MYTDMDWWTKIRLEVLRGERNKREILRREGIHWETLKKILTLFKGNYVRIKYEAGPCSFDFYDKLTADGIECIGGRVGRGRPLSF